MLSSLLTNKSGASHCYQETIHENAFDQWRDARVCRGHSVTKIVDRYMDCVEEIINIPTLVERFQAVVKEGHLSAVLDEIVLQSKVEFNYEEIAEDTEAGDEEAE